MASLAAGANTTLTLGAYDSVNVEVPTGGSCQVESPVGTVIAMVGSGSRTFGPYTTGAQVKLTAFGTAVRYDVTDGVYSPDVLSPAQVAALGAPKIAPSSPNVLFRFDGSVAKGVGYTVTHTGTGGTDSIDTTTSPFTGRNAGPSLKINAASTRTEIGVSGLNLAAFDGHVMVNCSVEDHTGTSLQLQVYIDGTGGRFFTHTHSVVTGTGVAPRNGHHAVACGPLANQDVVTNGIWTPGANSTFQVGVDAVTGIRVRVNGDGVGTRVGAVWIHSVVLVPRGRATVVMSYDDASKWMDNAVPHLNANGILGSFGIMTGAIGTNGALYSTVAEIQAIAAAGHEVCSHNVANTALAAPYGAAESDTYAAAFKSGLVALGGWIGDKASSIYHPWVQGYSSDLAVKRLRSHGVRIARIASPSRHNLIAATPGGGVFDGVMQLRSISTYSGAGIFTSAAVDRILDDCEKYGTTVCFMHHEVQDSETGSQISVALHRYICEQLARRTGIAKLTMGGLYRQMVDEGLV